MMRIVQPQRALRGGSYHYPRTLLTLRYRNSDEVTDDTPHLGFRMILWVPGAVPSTSRKVLLNRPPQLIKR